MTTALTHSRFKCLTVTQIQIILLKNSQNKFALIAYLKLWHCQAAKSTCLPRPLELDNFTVVYIPRAVNPGSLVGGATRGR